MRHSITQSLLPALLAVIAMLPARAEEPPPRHARARIVPEHRALRRGATNWLAVRFEIDSGWHLYWNGRNDSGLPPEVRPELPDGFRLGQPLWPVPERLLSPGPILDHVYSDHFTLLFPLEVPKAAAGHVALGFAVDWLACQEACVPEADSIAIAIDVVDGVAEPVDDALFRAARAALPEAATERPYALRWSARKDTASVVLELSDATAEGGRPRVAGLTFFPDRACSEVVDPGTTTLAQGPTLSLRLVKEKRKALLSGILELTFGNGTHRAYQISEKQK